jgi:hypothetical protein
MVFDAFVVVTCNTFLFNIDFKLYLIVLLYFCYVLGFFWFIFPVRLLSSSISAVFVIDH